jgi:hypothetical protein
MCVSLTLCYDSRLVRYTVVSLVVAKFKPFIFCTCDVSLFYAANVFILMIQYDS